MRVDSRPGAGTTFTDRPADGHCRDPRTSPPRSRPATRAPGRILLVDNDPQVLAHPRRDAEATPATTCVPVAERGRGPARLRPGGFDLVITNIGHGGDERLGRWPSGSARATRRSR